MIMEREEENYFPFPKTVADEQHWQFQTYKHSLTVEQKKEDPSDDVKRGFYTKGEKEITST